MLGRHETPAPTPGHLVTGAGAYRQGPRFNTYRENGTLDWLLIYKATPVSGTPKVKLSRVRVR